MRIPVVLLKLLVLIAVLGASGLGQQRTFVSGLGSDANPCTRTAPCRTFGAAIAQTNAGGEVIVLDSAGYGPVTITQSVSLIAPPGVYAGISVFSGDGIDINAGPSDTIILRGLTITNQGGLGKGIVFNSGRTLRIESCVASGFANGTGSTGIGIFGAGEIFIRDTVARGSLSGIKVLFLTPGTVSLTMDQLRLENNPGFGLNIGAGPSGGVANAVIRNSSISGNDGGVLLDGANGIASLDIESCLITNNTDGIIAEGQNGGIGAVSLSNCTLSRNPGAGFQLIGVGVIFSRGNNTIIGNGSNTGTLTPLAGQ